MAGHQGFIRGLNLPLFVKNKQIFRRYISLIDAKAELGT